MRMLTDVLDECHAEVRRLEAEVARLAADNATLRAQLAREGRQAAALITRLAGAVGGSPGDR